MRTNPWFRIAATAGGILFVLLLAASWRFAQSRGIFASVQDRAPGTCRALEGVTGVTAIAMDVRASTAFVASRQGALYAWHDGTLTKMAGTPKDFHPVALAVAHPPGAAAMLQALFDRAGGDPSIAIFNILPGKLVEVGRLGTDMLTDPADLAAVDGTRFYLVNRHGSRTALGRWLDDTFLVPRAEVLYFDGMKFVAVAGRLNSPSGLALSPDGSHLYVGEELSRSLASFTRSDFTGALGSTALLSLPAGPRKITPAPDGSLIVAAWPKRGAGAVYRVRLDGGVPQSSELLYATTHGEVTAAAEAGGHLLIGTETALVDCRL